MLYRSFFHAFRYSLHALCVFRFAGDTTAIPSVVTLAVQSHDSYEFPALHGVLRVIIKRMGDFPCLSFDKCIFFVYGINYVSPSGQFGGRVALTIF